MALDFLQPGDSGLVVDWTRMPVYNTIMAVAVGAALLLLVRFARQLREDPAGLSAEGYALAFGVVGFVLTTTGLHMTLTWPLAAYYPFDNIVFGEPSLGFGVMLSAAALYAWTRAPAALAGPEPEAEVFRVVQPVSVFAAGLGLGLFGIAAAGLGYQLFAAPPEEPIAGWFAGWPWLEAAFISGLFALVGVGAVALPWVTRGNALARRVAGTAWTAAGWTFLLFGAMNYFTHIGLILNTMENAP